jgi:hypothetical protein
MKISMKPLVHLLMKMITVQCRKKVLILLGMIRWSEMLRCH